MTGAHDMGAHDMDRRACLGEGSDRVTPGRWSGVDPPTVRHVCAQTETASRVMRGRPNMLSVGQSMDRRPFARHRAQCL